MDCDELVFSGHAIQQMFARGIRTGAVRRVIEGGEVIADYPDDLPFPSCLVLGWVEGRPLHVVVARDAARRRCYVVTAYIPDPLLWEADFKTRRKP
ncbi:MAG: DUF4258 domain-containing protein [Thermodesulfobacteriota bacterium]